MKGYKNARLTINLFCVIMVVGLFLGYSDYTKGFPSHQSAPVVFTLGLSFFLLLFPFFLSSFFERKRPKTALKWYHAESSLYLLTILAVFSVGFLPIEWSKLSCQFLGVTGFLLSLILILQFFSQLKQWREIAFVCFPLVLAVWLLHHIWTIGSTNPIFFELLFLGREDADALLHSTVAQMIDTYSVPSIGVNGLNFFFYHFGSHWMMAHLAKMVQLPTHEVYNFGFPLIFTGLHIKAFLFLILEAGACYEFKPRTEAFFKNYLFWFAFLIFAFGVMPPDGISRTRFTTLLTSESFSMSLSTMFFMLCSLVFWFRNNKRGKLDRFEVSDWLLWIGFVPLFLMISGFFKISTMLVLAPTIYLIGIRLGFIRKPVFILSLVCSILTCLVTFYFTHPRQTNEISFFPILDRVPKELWGWYYFFEAFWVIIYCLLRLHQNRVKNWKSIFDKFKSRELLDLEIVILLLFLGILPGALFTLDGTKNALFFMTYQSYISFCLFMSLCFYTNSFFSSPVKWRSFLICGYKPETIALCLIVTCMLLTSSNRFVLEVENYFRRKKVIRKQAIASNLHKLEIKKKISEQPDSHKIIIALNDLFYEVPRNKKKSSVVFISREHETYWSLGNRKGKTKPDCIISPYFAPMLTGMAVIEGKVCRANQRGYQSYEENEGIWKKKNVNPQKLCGYAQKEGFDKIFRLIRNSNGHYSFKEINCRVS